jgi:hypothetical protein
MGHPKSKCADADWIDALAKTVLFPVALLEKVLKLF